MSVRAMPHAGWRAAWPYRRYWLPEMAGVFALLLLVGVVGEWVSLDLATAAPFAGDSETGRWSRGDHPWLRALYLHTGAAVALVSLGAVAYIAFSFRFPSMRRWRIHALFVLLTIAAGPGIVVNSILKSAWGRPRPRQVEEFGGRLPYRAAFNPGLPGRGRSFPCGHCSAAFSGLAFYFVFRRGRPAWRAAAVVGSLAAGTAMSVARLAQGAHFVTDAVWAAGVVFLTAGILYYFVLNIPAREDSRRASDLAPGWKTFAMAIGLLAGIAAGAAVGTPQYREFGHVARGIEAAPAPIDVRLDLAGCAAEIVLSEGPDLRVTGRSEGFVGVGRGARDRFEVFASSAGPTAVVFRIAPHGAFVDLTTSLEVTLPTAALGSVDIRVRDGALVVRGDPGPATVVIRAASARIELPERLESRFAIEADSESRIVSSAAQAGPAPPASTERCGGLGRTD